MKIVSKIILSSLLVSGCGVTQDLTTYTWKENGKNKTMWVDSSYQATVEQNNDKVINLYRAADGIKADSHPVVRLSKQGVVYRVPAGGVIVSTTDFDALKTWALANNLQVEDMKIPNYWIVKTDASEIALQYAQEISNLAGVTTAQPNWYTGDMKKHN